MVIHGHPWSFDSSYTVSTTGWALSYRMLYKNKDNQQVMRRSDGVACRDITLEVLHCRVTGVVAVLVTVAAVGYNSFLSRSLLCIARLCVDDDAVQVH
jgi:hypothetical protein